jgi:hypothetical protein
MHSLDCSGSNLGQRAGDYECGNEPSGSIKRGRGGGEISRLAEELLVSQEGLGSMESVQYLIAKYIIPD